MVFNSSKVLAASICFSIACLFACDGGAKGFIGQGFFEGCRFEFVRTDASCLGNLVKDRSLSGIVRLPCACFRCLYWPALHFKGREVIHAALFVDDGLGTLIEARQGDDFCGGEFSLFCFCFFDLIFRPFFSVPFAIF